MENTQTLQLLNRQSHKSRLVFIEPTVKDYQSLVHGVLPNTEVVILDADSDGVEQISKLLTQRSGITSLHIVSHGAPGRVYLGNTELGQHTLNHYAGQLMYWAEAFSSDAQILLYGCNVAHAELGKVFVHRLSELTGTTVLASDDLTGSTALGGDWELKVRTGNITATVAFTPATLAAYEAVLANPYLVKDINPGSGNSTPTSNYFTSSYLTNVDGTLYFVANDSIHGNEVWKSDGTATGTVLLKDINPGYVGNYSNSSPSYLTNINGTLYFAAKDELNEQYVNYKLWKTDGTNAGTVLVKGLSYYPYSGIEALLNVDGILYFVFEERDSPSGDQDGLWKTNGTEEGTVKIKHYNNYYFAGIESLINVNGTVFFNLVNTDYYESYGLWKSDGTEEGTVPLQSLSNYYVSASNPFLTSINDTLFFYANDQQSYSLYNDNTTTGNYELWKTDGTTAGTVLVKDINSGSGSSSPSNPLDFNGTLYFNANDGTNGAELWKSDGTSAGTVLVKNINPGSGSSAPSNLTKVNHIFYFIAKNSSYGQELWKSDGTAAGTVLVEDINPGSANSAPSHLTNINGTLYFVANDGSHGQELWKSDGTAAGTVLVEDINLGSAGSDVSDLTYADGILYFLANDGIHGKELWALNIIPAAVSPVISITAIDANAGEADNDPIIFRISRTGDTSTALTVKYNIDGTATNGNDYNQLNGVATIAAGESFVDIATTPVDDIYREGSETVILTLSNQSYYGVDTSGVTAAAIIADNSSTAGVGQPYLVKDINTDNDDYEPTTILPFNLINVNGTLYFYADNGTNGYELWKSDGTAQGTVLVKDINLGSGSSVDYNRNDSYSKPDINLTNVNGIVYFIADDGTGNGLWKSDGTTQGTVLIKDVDASNLININDTLYFTTKIYNNSTYSYGLWKSDGTTQGTVLIKDVDASNLININDTLYFTTKIYNNSTYSYGLWKSDGTTQGTVLIKDINASNLTNINDTLLFFSRDQLWKSDGTTQGTVLVKDFNVFNYFSISNLTNFNGTLFFSATNGLWKSDGTTQGTVLVKNINASNLTNVNDIVYFVSDDGSGGSGLWKSDGTAEGTVLVKEIYSFYDFEDYSIFPVNLTNVNGILFFANNDYTYGDELWVSDGTEEGTILVKDIYPGFDSVIGGYSSYPSDLTNVNGILYFTANDGIHGKELWALNTNPPINPTVSITTTNANAVETGNSPSVFRISRTGNTNIALAVKYTIGGTASNGGDYNQLTGIASFAVGQSFADITITPLDDGLVEVSETVTLTLATGIDYDLDTSHTFATVAIADSINIINGGNNRDPLTGTDNSDRIVGGTGSKTITGGTGNDEFVYTNIREVGHRITDFTVGSDKIVLTELLDSLANGGYNGSNAIADGYVRLVQGSTTNSTILQIDRDGLMGSAVFRPFIQLDNVTPQAMNNISNFVF